MLVTFTSGVCADVMMFGEVAKQMMEIIGKVVKKEDIPAATQLQHMRRSIGQIREDLQQMDLAEERYRSWEWTYGNSPEFNVEKRQRFPGGEIDARLNVQQGVIRSVKFFGDFFAEVEPDGDADGGVPYFLNYDRFHGCRYRSLP